MAFLIFLLVGGNRVLGLLALDQDLDLAVVHDGVVDLPALLDGRVLRGLRFRSMPAAVWRQEPWTRAVIAERCPAMTAVG
ncbi:hypothetical protein ACFQ36_03220 [Arthrobacter sp. GCM10027362]|uniref:hypothetical protein n=1 Tax=Arthrobacter sp. GCM10027362 TaxID=3273379 RepID=UPI00363AC175